MVLAADSSQAIGSPVEQGKPLFTLGPLAGYRVVLKVDERDVPDISAQLLSATSLLTIAAVSPGVKLLHEIAHAWTERRGGAKVHDMGGCS